MAKNVNEVCSVINSELIS